MRIAKAAVDGAWLAGFLATGLLLGLGVRSLFHEAPGRETGPGAPAAPGHHESPGHDGHGHGGDAAPAPPSGEGGEGHGDHGTHGAPDAAPDPEREGLLVDLGNELCPIMGSPVDGKSYSVWNHLRIGHC